MRTSVVGRESGSANALPAAASVANADRRGRRWYVTPSGAASITIREGRPRQHGRASCERSAAGALSCALMLDRLSEAGLLLWAAAVIRTRTTLERRGSGAKREPETCTEMH